MFRSKSKHSPRVSIVICSIDRAKYDRVSSNYAALFKEIPFEIIGIHDAKSLAEAYNRALLQVRGEFVIFSHDDIQIVTPDFADRMVGHFTRFDIFGVAGTRKVIGGAWFLAGHPFDYMLVTSPKKEGDGLVIVGGGSGELVIDDIQALDGLFIAARTEVARKIGFDARTFDHFHLYDLDFTYRAFLDGYKIGVCRDLFIIHYSHGTFDEKWRTYRARFESKFSDLLRSTHVTTRSPIKNVAVDDAVFEDRHQVEELCRPETMRTFLPEPPTLEKAIGGDTGRVDREVVQRELVVIFSGRGANDAISGLMEDYGRALQDSGLSVVHVTFNQTEVEYAIKLMSERKVRFAMTWLGLGQDLAARTSSGSTGNIFELLDVPLVKIQGDLPAYYIDLHKNVPKNSINLYQAEEFLEFRERWLSDADTLAAQLPPMPMMPIDRSGIDMKARRQGELYFVKNGNSSQSLERKWEALLPAKTAEALKTMAYELRTRYLQAPRLLIGDFVADFLKADGIARPVPAPLVWFFSAQLDDYLRRVKSTMIAESLLDFPVVIQGDHWEHVDFTNRRARHMPGRSVNESQGIVTSELGVIDMAANVDTWPHDRVQRAAGAYSLVITDKHEWLTGEFPPDFSELSFEWDRESIASRISEVLRHRERYLELAIAFGEAFRERFPRSMFSERVMSLVDHATTLWQTPKPVLQEFFVWSRELKS